MRKSYLVSAALGCACLFALAILGPASAQDPLVVAPKMYKLLFENERVRVMEVVFNPGDSILPHSHPDHFVYAASGGTLRIFHPNDTGVVATVKPGDVLWINAETHWAKNTGATPVRLIVNELKEPRPAAMKEEKKEGK